MRVFGSTERGSFIELSNWISTASSHGISSAGILITSAEMRIEENYSVLPCFGSNYLYSFGTNLAKGSFRIGGIVSVGGDCGHRIDSMQRVVEFYSENRLSERLEVPLYLTLGDLVISGHMVGLSTNTFNSELHLQQVGFNFIINKIYAG